MTGKELWKEYQHYTRNFTEHARKLGFAGAAICWIFKTGDYRFPFLIYAALLCMIGYFISDILHALFGALTVRLFLERQEEKMWKETGSIEGEIIKPRWVDWPATVMFLFKALLLLLGFGFIGAELLRRLFRG